MTKSELIDQLAEFQRHLAHLDVELAVKSVLEQMSAALADGELEEREKSLIHDHLGEAGLSPEQVKQVQRDLVLPPSTSELAKHTDDPAHREAMYRFAGLVVLADDAVSDLERSWLDRLAKAFGFSGERKAELEAEIFAVTRA